MAIRDKSATKQVWSEDENKIFIENYNKVHHLKELLPILPGRTLSAFEKRAQYLKLSRKQWQGISNVNKYRGNNAIYHCDLEFFNKPSPERGYILGLIAADGNLRLRKTGGGISIKSIDKELLLKVRYILKSDNPINKSPQPGNYIYTYSIYSNELVRSIGQFSIYPRKEHTLKFPVLPENELSHFIRGYFDGDGSINAVNNHGKQNIKVSFYGNYDFIYSLQTVIHNKFTFKGTIKTQGNPSKNGHQTYYLYYGGVKSLVIMDWLYQDNPFLKMARKYSIYELAKKLLPIPEGSCI